MVWLLIRSARGVPREFAPSLNNGFVPEIPSAARFRGDNGGRERKEEPLLKAIIAISVGAALGALLRWGLGLRLNSLFPSIPPGTLAANLIGGYVVGLAIAFFADAPELSPEWRLFVITGFCGGLTTFSTFSAEIVALIQQGELTRMAAAISLHLAGSILMTIAGIATWQWLAVR